MLCLGILVSLLAIRPCFGGVFLWARCGVSCRMRFAYPTYRGGYCRPGKRGAIGQN